MESSTVAIAMSGNMTRLLIVADNSLIVEAIRIGFRKNGEFQLIGLVDARTACARSVLEAQPDVVLLDDAEGSDRPLELISAITENEEVMVIALSVQMDGDRLTRLLDAGATAVISKATHPGALATLVRETLNGHIVHKLGTLPTEIGSSAPTGSGDLSPLTGRELEILELVASGYRNGDIARRLWVTEQTVKFHLRNVYRKLDVANRTQASQFAYVNGLVHPQARPSVDREPELSVVS